jgi:hypothetical protein
MTGWTIGALTALLVLTACAQEPDFGRTTPGLIDRLDAAFISEPAGGSALPMTAAEAELRGLSANLLAPRAPAENDRLFGLTRMLDGPAPTALSGIGYYDALRAQRPASGEALIAAVAADADADTAQMERFVMVARQVTEADAARAQDLQAVPAGGDKARARVAENGRVIDDTGNALAARLGAYRIAFAHARADAPNAERLDVLEAALDRMGDQLAMMDRNALAHAVVVSDVRGGPSKS